MKSVRPFRTRPYYKLGSIVTAPETIVNVNVLNRARELRDIALPGFDFHPLKGNRKGEYVIGVTGNYRMTFRFDCGDVLDLNLEDYH